jgi:fructokinase
MAGLLAGLLEDKDALQNTERLEAVLRRANACGALATTKRGAIPALPRREELERFLASRA